MLVVDVRLNLVSLLTFQTSTGQILVKNDVTSARWLYPHPGICWLHFDTAGGATFQSIDAAADQEEDKIKDKLWGSTTEFQSK